jgi:Terpene cyclase DEP1
VNTQTTSTRSARGVRALTIIYGLIALGGLLGTHYFNLQSGNMKGGYVQGWFANFASSSAAVDLLVVFGVSAIFIIVGDDASACDGHGSTRSSPSPPQSPSRSRSICHTSTKPATNESAPHLARSCVTT